jgi:hypothetical protein
MTTRKTCLAAILVLCPGAALAAPKGEGFSAAAPNPCAASGNGVIPDTADAAKKARFQEAADKLKSGLSVDDRKDAMQIALDGADMIVAAAGD